MAFGGFKGFAKSAKPKKPKIKKAKITGRRPKAAKRPAKLKSSYTPKIKGTVKGFNAPKF